MSYAEFPKIRALKKSAPDLFKLNHKLCRLYNILIEGKGISETFETYHTYDILLKCRRYFECGIETKAYTMPKKVLIVDYFTPLSIERTYDGVPIGKQL